MKTEFNLKKVKKFFDSIDNNTIKFLYSFKDKETINVSDILSSNLLISTKISFLLYDCGMDRKFDNITQLTLSERKDILIKLCEIIVPKFKEFYPNDTRVIDCLETYKKYNASQITKEEYSPFKKACYDSCSKAFKDKEYGTAYNIAYAVYAISNKVNGDNGDGLEECIDVISKYKDCEEKALNMLKEFYNTSITIPKEESNNLDINIHDFLKDKDREKIFERFDETSKIDVLVKLIDLTIDASPSQEKDIRSFLSVVNAKEKHLFTKIKKLF